MPNTRPGLKFENGVCIACLNYEKQSSTNWNERKNELKNGILFIQSTNVRSLLAKTAFKIYNKIPKNIATSAILSIPTLIERLLLKNENKSESKRCSKL